MKSNITILTPQAIQSIECGLGRCTFLPKNYDLKLEEAQKILGPNELQTAQAFKHERRKSEFVRSRWLLKSVHGLTGEILRADSGEPISPKGFRVSLTHCQGHVIVCSANERDVLAVGIDLESVKRVKLDLAEKICNPKELGILTALGLSEQEALALVFSGKEALFKAIYPMGRKFFYFDAATINKASLGMIEGTLEEDTSPVTPAGTMFKIHWRALEMDGDLFFMTKVDIHFN